MIDQEQWNNLTPLERALLAHEVAAAQYARERQEMEALEKEFGNQCPELLRALYRAGRIG